MSPLYTHEQAAKKLGIHPATLHVWRQRGWISVCKRGRWVRYTAQALAEAVKESEIKADGHPPPRKTKGGPRG